MLNKNNFFRISLLSLCSFSFYGLAKAEGTTDLTIHYSTPGYVKSFKDDSHIELYGTVNMVESRDKHTGSSYKYAVLYTENAYRIKEIIPANNDEEGLDDSNITPTRFLPLLRENGDDKNIASYVGKYVKIIGKISSTNGGGPQIYYTSISTAKRDD